MLSRRAAAYEAWMATNFDRLYDALHAAARNATRLMWNAVPGADDCPLARMLRSLGQLEVDALRSLAAPAVRAHAVQPKSQRPPQSMNSYPPVRRLLAPFLPPRTRLHPPGWSADKIKAGLMRSDTEAMSALADALGIAPTA